MVEITLDTTKFQYISTFANIVGKTATDVEINGDSVVYYVPEEEYRSIRDKEFRFKLRLLENLLKKKVIIKPFSFNPINLVKILLGKKVRILEIYLAERDDGSKIIRVRLDRRTRIPYGKVKKIKSFIKKYFPEIQDIIINIG